jgi:hypothetical protein
MVGVAPDEQHVLGGLTPGQRATRRLMSRGLGRAAPDDACSGRGAGRRLE